VEDKDTRPTQAPNNQSNTPSKDSKFSFAFKSKASQPASTKAPPDLNVKAKPPPFRPADNRPPPTHPRKQDFSDKDFSRPADRRPPFNDRNQKPFPQNRKHPYDRPSQANQGQRPRSRSPPPKKLKSEPRPRPKLPPEFAASESIYYRKPGNESVVGAGTYGKVFKAIHIYTRDKVALKKIRMEGERDGFPITAVREIRLLQHLRHKHVVALQEVMVEKNEAYMVFEYLSHDLTGLINHPTFKLTPAHKKDLARQMFEGLDFLHRRGVLHRDIKAANILISSSGQLKFADFGLARFYTKSRQLDYTNRVITIWYRPPELLLGETQYGPAVDVWSAACVFMEMFTRKAVFPGEGGELSQLEKVYNVLGTPNRVEWPGIVDLPWYELMQPTQARKTRQFENLFKDVLSDAAMEVMKMCFEYDPMKRPSAEDVLQHPYFTAEEPEAKRAVELEDVKGDWHEFESKQHRRGEEKKRKAEWEREREKRKKAEREAKEGAGGRKESTASRIEGESEPPGAVLLEEDGSDGEGSARMSMS
jgi:CTD kinase subunit alpha